MEIETHHNYNCRITLEDGRESLVYANWMHNNGHDYWKGWNCQAGSTRLYIDKNLEVWSGECRNDHLGSALDPDFSILDGTTCRRNRCNGCTDDLIVGKERSKT